MRRNIIVLGKTGCGKSTVANKTVRADSYYGDSSMTDISSISLRGHKGNVVVLDSVC